MEDGKEISKHILTLATGVQTFFLKAHYSHSFFSIMKSLLRFILAIFYDLRFAKVNRIAGNKREERNWVYKVQKVVRFCIQFV